MGGEKTTYMIYGPTVRLEHKKWLDILNNCDNSESIYCDDCDDSYEFEGKLEKLGYFFGYDDCCNWDTCYIGVCVADVETFSEEQKNKVKKLCLENNLQKPKFIAVLNGEYE